MGKSGGNISTKPAKCKAFFRSGGDSHRPLPAENDPGNAGLSYFMCRAMNTSFACQLGDYRVDSLAGISVYCRKLSRFDRPTDTREVSTPCQVMHEIPLLVSRGML